MTVQQTRGEPKISSAKKEHTVQICNENKQNRTEQNEAKPDRVVS